MRDVTGIEPEVIDGEREAALSFLGGTRGLDPAVGPFLLIDIGGGSTSSSSGGARRRGYAISTQMGSVRLTERVHPSDPPTGDDLRHVETLVVEQLDEVERIVPIGEGRTLVAVAGTATTLQACALGLERYDPDLIHRSMLTLAAAERTLRELAAMTNEERAAIPVMPVGRGDVIVAGASILVHAMRRFGFEHALVSETDILDGLALELLGVRNLDRRCRSGVGIVSSRSLAARRQAERAAALRRRNLIVGILAGVVALVVVVAGLSVLLGDDTETAAPTPTPTSPQSVPSVEPGTKTGTVTPTAATGSGEVACGAVAPAKAGSRSPSSRVRRRWRSSGRRPTPPRCRPVRRDHRARSGAPSDRQLLRVPRRGGVLRRAVLPSSRHLDRRDPGWRSIEETAPERPGYAIPDELTGDESYTPGTLAMANAGANSGGSQFFLITGPAGTNLDGTRHSRSSGRWSKASTLRSGSRSPIVDPDSGDISGQRPAEAVYIESVTIEKAAAEGRQAVGSVSHASIPRGSPP